MNSLEKVTSFCKSFFVMLMKCLIGLLAVWLISVTEIMSDVASYLAIMKPLSNRMMEVWNE